MPSIQRSNTIYACNIRRGRAQIRDELRRAAEDGDVVAIDALATAYLFRDADMTPLDYVNEIVLPTMVELKENPRSRRLAYMACMAVFHTKDHLKKASERSIEQRMRTATGAHFDVVRAICNGTKHVQTDASHPIPFRAGDDFDRPPARAGEMVLGLSKLGDPVGGREIGRGPNRQDIYQACKSTLAAFCATFPKHLSKCDLSAL
jgi:hypothetical protein